MTERPHPQPTTHDRQPPPPDRRPIRERVSAEVLAYLDWNRAEMGAIAERYGTKDLRELRTKVGTGEVSTADGSRLAKLVEAFERAARENEVPASELRRRETEAEQRKREFLDALEGVAEACDASKKPVSRLVDSANPSEWTPELRAAVDALPPLPAAVLLGSDTLMADIIHVLQARSPLNFYVDIGLMASMAMNRSMRDLPSELRDKVVQRIDANGMKHLGYAWGGGTLIVRGDAGGSLGRGMTGGHIFAEYVSSHAGYQMRGGTLVITGDRETIYAGNRMEGGEIRMKRAGYETGGYMSGGLISAEVGDSNIGKEMTGGRVVIKGKAGKDLDRDMRGGEIEAGEAEGSVGWRMMSGIIRVERATGSVGAEMIGGRIEVGTCAYAGFEMKGGGIVVRDLCSVEAGVSMTGGKIRVNDALAVGRNMSRGLIEIFGKAGVVGEDMKNGEIRIHGETERFGTNRTGGKIRFAGKGAWWKNLWALFK